VVSLKTAIRHYRSSNSLSAHTALGGTSTIFEVRLLILSSIHSSFHNS